MQPEFTSIEICAGAGGQALGLESANFEHVAVVEIDNAACATLRQNRPSWNVVEQDLKTFSGSNFKGVDLLAGGVPCPPFSVAGKQLGQSDERDLFPTALRLVEECQPRAVMIENVRGILDPIFSGYRRGVSEQLKKLGYKSGWKQLNACHFGVSQLRPRVVLVAVRSGLEHAFQWPSPNNEVPPTVGELLQDEMGSREWTQALEWSKRANGIAPTIVGGSKKHGGPDLGPTRAKRAWQMLGVDGHGLADLPPEKDFVGDPRLTVRMVALLQGFPLTWRFSGKKTTAYRQVGNAFPPPVAQAVGEQIRKCLAARRCSSHPLPSRRTENSTSPLKGGPMEQVPLFGDS